MKLRALAVTTAIASTAVACGGTDSSSGRACPEPGTTRFTQQELHRAYEMTRQMSRPESRPMWDDEQLRLSLTDPTFVAELERHFCEMERMLGER